MDDLHGDLDSHYPDGRKFIDDPVPDVDVAQYAEEYEFFRRWHQEQAVLDVVDAVARTHEEIYLAFLDELQSAIGLLYQSDERDARLMAYVRGYRAVDHYAQELSNAIVQAFAAPYAKLFGMEIRPRLFFQRAVLEAVKARVFDDAFHGPVVRETIAEFFRRHREVRNQVMHGLHVPTHDELRAMIADAKQVHDLADGALHPHATHPLTLLDPGDYPHDDYRPPAVF